MMLWYILEERIDGKWRMFLQLGCKLGHTRSLLTWAAGWFDYSNAPDWRLLRVSQPLEWHGIWDGERMKHRPLCRGTRL